MKKKKKSKKDVDISLLAESDDSSSGTSDSDDAKLKKPKGIYAKEALERFRRKYPRKMARVVVRLMAIASKQKLDGFEFDLWFERVIACEDHRTLGMLLYLVGQIVQDLLGGQSDEALCDANCGGACPNSSSSSVSAASKPS